MKKHFKFSLGMKIAAILSCLAIVSMGFASWWIVKTPEETTVGDFTVYEADVKRIKFDVKDINNGSAPNIVFGKPTNPTSGGWLIPGADVATEDLQATIVFDVYVADESDSGAITADTSTTLDTLLSNITVNFAPNETIAQALNNAIKNKYITAPVIDATYTYEGAAAAVDTVEAKTYTYDSDDLSKAGGATLTIAAPAQTKITVTLTITFDWGDAFKATINDTTDNYNPHIYYNNLTNNPTDEQIVQAKNALNALWAMKAADTATEYKLTLDANTK